MSPAPLVIEEKDKKGGDTECLLTQLPTAIGGLLGLKIDEALGFGLMRIKED